MVRTLAMQVLCNFFQEVRSDSTPYSKVQNSLILRFPSCQTAVMQRSFSHSLLMLLLMNTILSSAISVSQTCMANITSHENNDNERCGMWKTFDQFATFTPLNARALQLLNTN